MSNNFQYYFVLVGQTDIRQYLETCNPIHKGDVINFSGHNPDVSETTVRHPNELKLNWLKAEGLLIVFMYTHLSSREVIKSVKRFKRSIRKVYGREQYNNLTSRLVLHYIWSGNSVDVLESYKKAVIGPLTNPVNYSWFAPAGTDKGIADETL